MYTPSRKTKPRNIPPNHKRNEQSNVFVSSTVDESDYTLIDYTLISEPNFVQHVDKKNLGYAVSLDLVANDQCIIYAEVCKNEGKNRIDIRIFTKRDGNIAPYVETIAQFEFGLGVHIDILNSNFTHCLYLTTKTSDEDPPSLLRVDLLAFVKAKSDYKLNPIIPPLPNFKKVQNEILQTGEEIREAFTLEADEFFKTNQNRILRLTTSDRKTAGFAVCYKCNLPVKVTPM